MNEVKQKKNPKPQWPSNVNHLQPTNFLKGLEVPFPITNRSLKKSVPTFTLFQHKRLKTAALRGSVVNPFDHYDML